MMHQPNGDLPPTPFNPYAAPRTETMPPDAPVEGSFRPSGIIVLCGAILGVLVSYFSILAWQGSVDLTGPFVVMMLVELAKGALAGAGIGILLDALLQRKFAQLAPGHWFLLLLLASMIAQTSAEAWGTGPDIEISFTSFGAWYFVQTVVYQSLVLVLMTPIALTTAEPIRWKALIWGMLLLAVVSLLQFPSAIFDQVAVLGMISIILMTSSALGSFALAVAVLVMIVVEATTDRPRTKSRDRYHWLGIFGPAGLTFLLIVLGIGYGFG